MTVSFIGVKIIYYLLLFVIWTLLTRFSVRNGKHFGSSLLFFGSEHSSAKVAKISAFPLKLITNLMSRNTARMHRMFLSFRNVFNIDQQVLELVVLSDNF